MTQTQFVALLRTLGDKEIIEQMNDKTLLLGGVGEKIAGHYSFYAAFQSPEEYRIMVGSRTLGTLPIDFPLAVDDTIIFACRR